MKTAARGNPAGAPGACIRLADGEGSFDPRRIVWTRHSLAGHPLLQYEHLRKLALSLSGTHHIRQAARNATIRSPFRPLVEADAGRTVAEAFENIDLPGTWIALYNLEELPEYRALLHEVLSSVLQALSPADSRLVDVGGFAFIAGPGAVWPFHLDRDNNFHIQIRGNKDYMLWSPDDRAAVSPAAVEAVVTRSNYDDVRYKDDMAARCASFTLGPGEGVHIPGTAGLSIRTGSLPDPSGGPAVSMALTYCTRVSRRKVCVYAANSLLRNRFGVAPEPPGKSRLADAVKFPVGRALMLYQRWAGQ
jgi:hypothetical protein